MFLERTAAAVIIALILEKKKVKLKETKKKILSKTLS